MRFITKALCTFALLTLLAPVAKADLLVEPYVGYGLSATSYNPTTAPGDSTDGGGGVVIGGRLGIAMPLIWFAADYAVASASMKNATGTGVGDYTTSDSTLYGVVGLKIPLIQAYAGYGFMDNMTAKYTSGDQKFSGTALKFGVGFTGLPIVSLNLEYQTHNFTKYTPSGGSETDISAGYSKYSNSVVLFSISAPFRF